MMLALEFVPTSNTNNAKIRRCITFSISSSLPESNLELILPPYSQPFIRTKRKFHK